MGVELVIGPAAQSLGTDDSASSPIDADRYRPLLDAVTREDCVWAYGLGATPDAGRVFEQLGFSAEFYLGCRRLYLGIGAVVGHVSSRRFGIRRFARASRQLRNRLIEVEFEPDWLRQASTVFAEAIESKGLSLDRSVERMTTQFDDPSQQPGFLVLRRQTGKSIDAYVIFSEREDEKGRRILGLMDYWTREASRRALIWLMGELSVWSLAVGFDVVEAFLVTGSLADQAFIVSGGFRKKTTYPVYCKSLSRDYQPDYQDIHFRPSDFSFNFSRPS